MSWLTYSILATISIGFSMVFYKLPSQKNYSSFISTIVTNIISGIMIVVALYVTNGFAHIHKFSWYGLGWGALFALSMVLYKKLLNGRETGIIFPIVSSIGNTITILVGLIFLSEILSFIQILGIAIIVLSVFFFQKKEGRLVFNNNAIKIAIGILIFSTAQKFIQKLGAIHDTTQEFMITQYVGAALFACVLTLIFERQSFGDILKVKKYIKGALLISIFSVIGGFAILKALSLAPLSKVYAIHPMYTFVTAVLGIWLFKEKVTAQKAILVLVSILGVVLLRIG